MKTNKELLLFQLKENIVKIQLKIKEKISVVQKLTKQSPSELLKIFRGDDEVAFINLTNAQKREIELEHLHNSPYFTKCQIIDESGKQKDYYFAKHEFMEQSIYSWTAPMAILRFENLGQVTYRLPNGVKRQVTITEKEHYNIIDGKVIFFAQEKQGSTRELIYQENFTRSRLEFALPEIVAQMEKAQDQVIRAHYKGPLIIAGPAGSGKTTLALHRVAYLTQAPDTSEHYKFQNMLVIVQDERTKKYFSSLLPSLGINDCQITTFPAWALKILDLDNYLYTDLMDLTEANRNIYEFEKLKSLREFEIEKWSKNIYSLLNKQYKNLSPETQKIFAEQNKRKQLDRFDLTILLQAYLNKFDSFETKREYNKYINDRLVSKTEKKKINYALMIIDEFQNYLPEQLKIFNHCLYPETKSIIYVGDIAQQVKVGTIKNWTQINSDILAERNIRLEKVYRNSKNILEFIKNLDYNIIIPEQIKLGPPVIEKITKSQTEEITYIKNKLKNNITENIGILTKDKAYLIPFELEFKNNKNIHCLSILESQGVEFDQVFMVGINKKFFALNQMSNLPIEYQSEIKTIQRDLIYVGLTRAVSELHLLGENNIKELL